MKRNMIMLVLDSITYTRLNESNMRECPAPFLKELMDNSVRITNMFSQAPYTEAAVVSLQCGSNTLDNYGHMRRNKGKNTIFDIYQNAGYRVYSNAYQPATYPTGQMPEFKDRYYNTGFMFSQAWDFRLDYFKNLLENEGLDEQEKELVSDIVEDNFIGWIKYFEDIINKDKSLNMIYDTLNKDGIEDNYKLLMGEYKKFNKEKIEYSIDLLKKGKEHNLFKIKDYIPTQRIIDRKFVLSEGKKRKGIIRKILYKNLWSNLKNNRMSMHVIKNFIKGKEYSKLSRYFLNYLNAVIDKDLYKRIDKNYDNMKYVSSLNTMLDHFMNWEKENKEPYFAYIHAEDNHFQETFFTYDSTDEKLLDEEFEDISKYLKKIKKNYKGSIAYDLSLLYSDRCIKRFYNELKKSGKLDNTDIIITADHGYSYYYNPIRERFVTNYYRETYNIPFIIISNNCKKIRKPDAYYQSKDIVATMLSLSGIKKPNSVTGTSLFDYEGKDYAVIEYMGGGSPHYYKRPFMLGIRNDNYSIVVEIGLNDEFKNYKIVTLFDLKKDPEELNNLKYSNYDLSKLSKELKLIEKRFLELKANINKQGYYKD